MALGEDAISQLEGSAKAMKVAYAITSGLETTKESAQLGDAMKATEEQLVSPASAVNVTYDADRAQFAITIQGEIPPHAGGSTLRVGNGPVSRHSYVGSNGFGAVREVAEYEFTEYNLVAANSAAFPLTSKAPKRFYIHVPMGPEQAQRVKSQIRVLAVCRLVRPFVAAGKLRKDPTHEDPVSLKINYSFLNVNILEFLVFNHETGEIYAVATPN